MKILSIGGGPAGLYLGILMKSLDPSHEITVIERNRPDDTFGFGVVFSERTLDNIQHGDAITYDEIALHSQIWDAIEVRIGGKTMRCGGNGFSAIARKRLLNILQKRAIQLGVELRFQTEAMPPSAYTDYDVIVAADGANSMVRRIYAEHFHPSIEIGKAKYIWFGTTKHFDCLTFPFEQNEHGIFAVHAYPFDDKTSTFIVETDEQSWRNAGLDRNVEATLAPGVSDMESRAYCQKLFAKQLDGHKLIVNNSK
ncbi:MAG TPA: 2-polyprenyl-6-methoxyphenol hydroxylase, partial [Ktedonobacter sp.]|nr:2-polyprenyl-6-methoxyphenol hydroxylase [Ktedonobacter sp.]